VDESDFDDVDELSDVDDSVPVRKKRQPAAFQSDTPGVRWHSLKRKWQGRVCDRLQRKRTNTPYFSSQADRKKAIAKLRADEEARFEAEVATRVAADAKLSGLSRAPANAKDATAGTVYWHVHKKSKYVPYRAVVVGNGGARPYYKPACQDCHQMARANVSNGPRTHCTQHGGGGVLRCAHGVKSRCRECNRNVTNCVSNCSSCGARLYAKRMATKGGNGLCAMCEERQINEAAEAGADPPKKGERWEDVVVNKLTEKVVDSEIGFPFVCEMRDSRSHMLGSNGKRRRAECDTTKQRRPELLSHVKVRSSREGWESANSKAIACCGNRPSKSFLFFLVSDISFAFQWASTGP